MGEVIGEEALTRIWLLEKPGKVCDRVKAIFQTRKQPARRYGMMSRGLLE